MEGLKKYFNAVSTEIHVKAERSGVFTNPSDKGYIRERILLNFLSEHLPKRLHAVLGGNIFGGDSISSQIDIIISNDIAVNYEDLGKTFVAVENVASAISVKSNLDKDSLDDSLKNIASIPQINKKILEFNSPLFTLEDYEKFLRAFPVLFIFAYDGVSIGTCVEHLKSFYNEEENRSIDLNRYPRAIIVNRKYIIRFPRHEVTFIDGEKGQKDCFHSSPLNNEVIGIPFSNMLNHINDYISWLPMMKLNYHYYTNKSFFNKSID